MREISPREFADLLKKLGEDQTAVTAFLFAPTGSRSRIKGFLNSATSQNGIVISDVSPPRIGTAWINTNPFNRTCDVSYGEMREAEEADRAAFSGEYGESLLRMYFPDSQELFVLLFTI